MSARADFTVRYVVNARLVIKNTVIGVARVARRTIRVRIFVLSAGRQYIIKERNAFRVVAACIYSILVATK